MVNKRWSVSGGGIRPRAGGKIDSAHRRPAGRFLKACTGLCIGLLVTLGAQAVPEPPTPATAPRFLSVGADVLPRAVVNALVQDSTGFLWVASGDGLMRFDGYRFTPRTRHGAAATDNNLGWIHALLPGEDGQLWIGTEAQGLAWYDPGSDRIELVSAPATGSAPHPLITAVARAADGTVWVGRMGEGLEERPPGGQPVRRYRGGAGSGQLPDDRVLAVLADRAGGLWVGTWQGLVYRAPGQSTFEPLAGGAEPLLQDLAVQRLFQASDGQIWAGTRQGHLLRVDPADRRVQWLALPPAAGGAVTAFAEPPSDGPQRVWVGRTTGIDQHRSSDGRWMQALRHDPRNPSGLGANHVTSLLLDRDGWVWVGSLGGGLQRHNPRPAALVLRGGDAEPDSPLYNPSAHSVLVLPARAGEGEGEGGGSGAVTGAGGAVTEEEVWVGTQDAGVVVLDAQLRVRATLRLPAQPLHASPAPPDAALVAAGQGPAGVRPPAPDSQARVEAMARAPDGSVWLAAAGGLHHVSPQRQTMRRLWHEGGGTHQMRVGQDGSLWVATQAGLLRWRPGEDQAQLLQPQASAQGVLPLVGEVYTVAEAADGSWWVGSFHGLWRVPAGADTLEPVAAAPESGLGGTPVIGLLFDRQQRLWLDTAVTGLHRMTQWRDRKPRFDAISRRLGRVGKPFGANLLEDARGRIWSHLHVYDPVTDRIDELTITDGQVLGTGWFGAQAQHADGRMLFGGSRGLLQVQPEAFEPAQDTPPLVVTQLRINGQPQPAAGLAPATLAVQHRAAAGAVPAGLVLQPSQRSFGLELAALEYGEPGRVRYAWQLQGYDDDWTQSGADQRQLTYANLPPGHYLLRARATNRSGVWTDAELAIPVQVLPAWWQHTATRVLFGVALLGLLLAAVHWRTRALQRRQRTLARTVAERTQQLQDLTHALQRESAALKEASLTDPLTGLRNRRFLADHIDADVAASVRRWQDHLQHGSPSQDAAQSAVAPPATADLLFFLVDIDHFKRVNDVHGHGAGDAVVRQMRSRLQRVFRDSDYMVRWGGEEFLIVARGTSRSHAADLAERARQAVAAEPFAIPEGEPLPCTCSLGFASFPLSTRHPGAVSWSTVVMLADAALYRAKAHGRNTWAGVLDADALDEAALTRQRTGPLWLADAGLHQQCAWAPPAAD